MFIKARKRLGRTQKQLAELLGVSLKAVHSYEQGWRLVPASVERQLFFLVSRVGGNDPGRRPCWVINGCPHERRERCPAWEFQAGRLCWFINGTICGGAVYKSWHEKMELCRQCEVLSDDVLSLLS